MQQVGENIFSLDLLPYMGIYSMVNSKNINFFKPSMLKEDEDAGPIFPSIEDLVSNVHAGLGKDTIL